MTATEKANDIKQSLEGLPCPICTDNMTRKQLVELYDELAREIKACLGIKVLDFDNERCSELWWEWLEKYALQDYGCRYYEDIEAEEEAAGIKWVTCPDASSYEVSSSGILRNKKSRRILNSWKLDKTGRAPVRCDDGKVRMKSVKHMVADAFLDNPNKHKFVHSIDGNIANADVSNLMWVAAPILKSAIKKSLSERSKRRLLGKLGSESLRAETILCVETSTIYFGCREAASHVGTTHQNIANAIKKGHHAAGYHWKKVKIYKEENNND